MTASDHTLQTVQKSLAPTGASIHAQIILRPDYPLPQTDLAYGHGTRYAKSCEAVQGRGTDLDLRNLPIEVAHREALTE